MRRRLLLVALACAGLLAVAPASALAGTYTLHPSGFGTMSYSAWKAQQGEPDSHGNQNQALYFQKMTSTATFAAGVSVIKGYEGLPADQLTGLQWDHRDDGHCGAGAPRWNIGLQDATGHTYTVFLGCNAATHTPVSGTFSGHAWCTDTQPSPAAAILSQTGVPATQLTIRYLAIVFDEGNDTPNPPPAGCPQEQLGGGFIYLDNIKVTTTQGTHTWTSASDNGNGQTIWQDPTGQDYVSSLINAPVTSLFP